MRRTDHGTGGHSADGYGALRPGEVTDALTLPVDLDGITGMVELGALGEAAVGVWEMTPGVDEDVEDDEIFVVLAGRGTVEFLGTEDDADSGVSSGATSGAANQGSPAAGALPTIDLRPGSVVRLTAGTRTRWTVTETLRKLWIG